MLQTVFAQRHPIPNEHVPSLHVDLEGYPFEWHDSHVPNQHEPLHVFSFRKYDLEPIESSFLAHFYLADFQCTPFSLKIDFVDSPEVPFVESYPLGAVHFLMRNDRDVRSLLVLPKL